MSPSNVALPIVLPAPTITDFTPKTGPVGTTVTLTGQFFTGATSVVFNNGKKALFTVVNDTTINTVVPEGATTGKITVYTLGGSGKTSQDFVVPSGAIVKSLDLTKTAYPWQTITGTVTLSDVVAVDTTVDLASTNTSLVPIPATLTIPAGSSSGTFAVITGDTTVSSVATVTASLNSTSKSADVTITPWTLTLSLSPTSVLGGAENSTGIVTLTTKAPSGGLTVVLKSSDESAATVPTQVKIAAGKKSASFAITSKKVTKNKKPVITATLDTSALATLTVRAETIGTLVLVPNTVTGGDNSIGIITLNAAVTTDTTVTLKSSNTNVATVPTTVVIKAGEKSVTFDIDTNTVTAAASVTITATVNGQSITGVLKVTP